MRTVAILVASSLLLTGWATSQEPKAKPRPKERPFEVRADKNIDSELFRWTVEEQLAREKYSEDLERVHYRKWAVEDALDEKSTLESPLEVLVVQEPGKPKAKWQGYQPALDSRFELLQSDQTGHRMTLLQPAWGQPRGPEDSLYKAAREALNRGEYRRASELLATFVQRFPQSRSVPAANYWQAFSLYRAGTDADLSRALRILDELVKQSSIAAEDPDVAALMTRVVGTMASRGNAEAAERLRQDANRGAASCDREDMQVRETALSALVQNDPDGSLPVLRRILGRRDECSIPLRRRAVYLLGKDADASRVDEVLEIAKNDPSREVRSDAISRLAQIPGEASTDVLEQFLTSNADEFTQRSVIQALRGREDAPAGRIIRRAVEREDLPEQVRVDAIRGLASSPCCVATVAPRLSVTGAPIPGRLTTPRSQITLSDSDVSLLRRVFDKTTSRTIKTAVVETMARGGGPATDGWLIGLVRNSNEDLRFRTAALGRLRRAETPIDSLSKLYDALTERELRLTLLRVLSERDEAAATDKLIDVVKTGTDPTIKREAISMLSRKKDPRTTKFLLELVEK
jgi:HEAT repeat protein